MASVETYSSGNASENFNVIFIKMVWFSTNVIKTSYLFIFFKLESSILHFKERATAPFCGDCHRHSMRHGAVPVARRTSSVS